MKIYLATIDLPCLAYGYIFAVKADNKKDAQQKVYNHCKDRFDYKKSDIIINSLEELFAESEVIEIQ